MKLKYKNNKIIKYTFDFSLKKSVYFWWDNNQGNDKQRNSEDKRDCFIPASSWIIWGPNNFRSDLKNYAFYDLGSAENKFLFGSIFFLSPFKFTFIIYNIDGIQIFFPNLKRNY